MMQFVREELYRVIERCYSAGLTDSQIADAAQTTFGVVSYWRTKRQLPKNNSPRTESYTVLYGMGMVDNDIARIMHVNNNVVCDWRHRRGLPSNGYVGSPRIKKSQEAIEKLYSKIEKLYFRGYGDAGIADKLKINKSMVVRWRNIYGLPKVWDWSNSEFMNKDPESLYCDEKFIEKIVNNNLNFNLPFFCF
jgi:transposase-like protein